VIVPPDYCPFVFDAISGRGLSGCVRHEAVRADGSIAHDNWRSNAYERPMD